MALPIPKIDDRTYLDLRRSLVDEIARLPGDWTDHNPSDPGIALIELLSAMGEMLIYRMDQIPDRVYANFLKMVIDRPEPVTTEVRFTRSAALAALPAGLEFPAELGDRIEYDAANGRLIFYGAMTNAGKDLLDQISTDADYRTAVKELFEKYNYPVDLTAIPAGVRLPARISRRIEFNATEGQHYFHGAMTVEEKSILEGLSSDAGFLTYVSELYEKSNRGSTIRAGTQLSGPEISNGPLRWVPVFETVREIEIPGSQSSVFVTARDRHVESGRELGRSDATPNQAFALLDSNTADSEVRPVLLEPLRQRSDIYNPNPRVTVEYESGGVVVQETWQYMQDLLEVGKEKVFTVEWLTYEVQFGDGIHGSIPPDGALIRCESFQSIRGKQYQIPAGALTRILRSVEPLETMPPSVSIPPSLTGKLNYDSDAKLLVLQGCLNADERDDLLALAPVPGDPTDPTYQQIIAFRIAVTALFERSGLVVTNLADAVGGRHLYNLDGARHEGLKALQESERAIAGRDFTYMTSTVFNELNGISGQRKVKRAHAVRLDDLGTMAIIVIPEPKTSADRWPTASDDFKFKWKIYRFLDQRRLITTRLLIGDPQYRPVRIDAEVKPQRNIDTNKLIKEIVSRVNDFFDPIGGGQDREGWPLGRGVYRSEIIHLISLIEEVDYIKTVILDGSASKNAIAFSQLQLPKIKITAANVKIL